MIPRSNIQSPGRPREFDVKEALRLAIEVFRQRGYTATSIVDLIKGMKLSRGSFYKAFYDKKSLFAAAYDMYATEGAARLKVIAQSTGTGRERIAKVIDCYAELSQGRSGQRGCLVIATAVELSLHEPDIASRVLSSWELSETLLCDLIREGEEDGSITAQQDREVTARSFLCLMQGMRLIGKSNAHAQTGFKAVAHQALKLLD